MAKLDDKYIKNKIKAQYGELQVYNPQFMKEVYQELINLIKDNSKQVDLENNLTDIEIDNTIQIMRFMLENLTNIEHEWDELPDVELENLLNLADGEFKDVVNSLLDIMLEIGQDIRSEEIRKLKIIKEKLKEVTEAFKFNKDIDETLKEFGLDMDKLALIQSGDKKVIEEFQKNLIEQVKNSPIKKKSNRQSNKK